MSQSTRGTVASARRAKCTLAVVLLFTVCSPLVGQPGESSSRLAAAVAGGEWKTVTRLLEKQANSEGLTGQEWFQLGFARFQLERNEAALEAYSRARSAGFSSPRMLGTEATLFARLGRHDDALTALEGAVAAGMPFGVLDREPAFGPLRDREAFQTLLAAARARSFPCEAEEESRQFDFWIGDWTVSANGAQVGVNEISSRHGGCLIFEDYTAGAYTGQSFNFYDPAIGRWRQIWVDNRGNVTLYEGDLEGKAMVFEGRSQGRTGPAQRLRMTFSPLESGAVRQLIESWSDETESWTTNFDGLYERENEGED